MKFVRKEIKLTGDQIKELEKWAKLENHSAKSFIEKLVLDFLLSKKIKGE
jgi:hypothetical protein